MTLKIAAQSEDGRTLARASLATSWQRFLVGLLAFSSEIDLRGKAEVVITLRRGVGEDFGRMLPDISEAPRGGRP